MRVEVAPGKLAYEGLSSFGVAADSGDDLRRPQPSVLEVDGQPAGCVQIGSISFLRVTIDPLQEVVEARPRWFFSGARRSASQHMPPGPGIVSHVWRTGLRSKTQRLPGPGAIERREDLVRVPTSRKNRAGRMHEAATVGDNFYAASHRSISLNTVWSYFAVHMDGFRSHFRSDLWNNFGWVANLDSQPSTELVQSLVQVLESASEERAPAFRDPLEQRRIHDEERSHVVS